jgi:hypothetical protein
MIFIIIFILIGLTVCFADDMPNKQAFRDLYWGDSVEKLGDVHLVEDTRGIKIYEKINENLKIGDLEVISIVYLFWDNKLLSVIIDSQDPRSLSRLAKAKFGYPKEENRFMLNEQYVYKDTSCGVKENIGRNTGRMILLSRSISEEHKKWEKEQAEKNSKVF